MKKSVLKVYLAQINVFRHFWPFSKINYFFCKSCLCSTVCITLTLLLGQHYYECAQMCLLPVSLVIIEMKDKENSSESSIATILKILKSRFRLHVVCCPNLYNLLWRLVNTWNCINVTNLSLLDVFHLDCLNKFAASLPPSTAPAGYTCPNCKVSVCFDVSFLQ